MVVLVIEMSYGGYPPVIAIAISPWSFVQVGGATSLGVATKSAVGEIMVTLLESSEHKVLPASVSVTLTK